MKSGRGRFYGILMPVMVVLIAAVWQFAWAQEQGKEVITVRGSESTAWMVDSYAKEFMKTNPNANIVVSGGAGIGWEALLNHECQIAMSSRQIEPEEKEAATKKGLDIQEKHIGWGGIVIVVHPSNPVNELTVDQVRKVLSGQHSNWSQVSGPDKPIAVLTIGEERPGTLHYIQHDFLHGSLAPNAITKTFFSAVVSGVTESETATSFIRVRNIFQLKEKGQESKIKVIAIKKDDQSPAILPSRETVDKGTYPITRPYFLYIDTKSAGKLTKDFVEFCGSKNPRPM
ncbi:MAG: PstS family phosphate ABC transporter substrate-binding protein [Desulfomonilaceae bacterium]